MFAQGVLFYAYRFVGLYRLYAHQSHVYANIEILRCLNIGVDNKWLIENKGASVVYKDSYIPRQEYEYLKKNDPSKLITSDDYKQQSFSRYALQDFLEQDFQWHYWLVVVFGFRPQKNEVDRTLYASHYKFDRWLLTNNKLTSIPVDVRSKWVCLPEYGSGEHLHYNCFLQLNVNPDIKTYESEWNAMRVAFKRIFNELEKGQEGDTTKRNIEFRLYERQRCDIAKVVSYSSKEMTQKYINEKGRDNFADMIMSWRDWDVKPLNGKSPKKIDKLPQIPPKESVLTKYMC